MAAALAGCSAVAGEEAEATGSVSSALSCPTGYALGINPVTHAQTCVKIGGSAPPPQPLSTLLTQSFAVTATTFETTFITPSPGVAAKLDILNGTTVLATKSDASAVTFHDFAFTALTIPTCTSLTYRITFPDGVIDTGPIHLQVTYPISLTLHADVGGVSGSVVVNGPGAPLPVSVNKGAAVLSNADETFGQSATGSTALVTVFDQCSQFSISQSVPLCGAAGQAPCAETDPKVSGCASGATLNLHGVCEGDFNTSCINLSNGYGWFGDDGNLALNAWATLHADGTCENHGSVSNDHYSTQGAHYNVSLTLDALGSGEPIFSFNDVDVPRKTAQHQWASVCVVPPAILKAKFDAIVANPSGRCFINASSDWTGDSSGGPGCDCTVDPGCDGCDDSQETIAPPSE